MKIRKLHSRLVFAFGLLLIVVQIIFLVSINTVLSKSTHDDIRLSLTAGELVFNLLREDNTQQLVQSSSILSSDFAFRGAIASGDSATIASALSNHGARIDADLMMLVGTDNRLIADALQTNPAGSQFEFPELIERAESQGRASAMVMAGDRLYQMVVVPVRAPLPIAWLVLGFHIDEKFAGNLKTLTTLDVSFLSRRRSADRWQMLASTLPKATALELTHTLPAVPTLSPASTLAVAGEDYVTLSSRLETREDITMVAVLQRSLHQALTPLRRLQMILLMVSGLSLLAALLASDRIARSITRPLRELSSLAEYTQRGDYSRTAATDRVDEIGSLAIAFNHMNTGLAAREARISDLAYRDQVTGLPNRRLFNDRLKQALGVVQRTGTQFSVLLMDLDRFKEVNDILGHGSGDQLLKQVGERLQSSLMRDSDTVARLGGDEFALLLPGSDAAGAINVAQKLLICLEEPVLLEGQKLIAGGSIGIVTCPEQGDQNEVLLRRAEMAMYVAKRNNSGYVVFDPIYEEQDEQHLSLMAELRHAVDHGELRLFYQPKVDIASSTITQAEALVRWKHPRRGLVPPNLFIPYAENTGFIRAITRWVIEEALRQRRIWEEQNLPLTISINISARDLINTELPELFAGLMRTYDAAPYWLSLEITESAIMGNPGRAMTILARLHAMQLHLSIDDFGTGYSSLAYLKKMPVSEIKIDQSFVTNMETDKDDATIVRSTIDLGHNMGLAVVAEGIENAATMQMLSDMGCDLAQGYYISRPLAADDFVRWAEASPWKLVRKD